MGTGRGATVDDVRLSSLYVRTNLSGSGLICSCVSDQYVHVFRRLQDDINSLLSVPSAA